MQSALQGQAEACREDADKDRPGQGQTTDKGNERGPACSPEKGRARTYLRRVSAAALSRLTGNNSTEGLPATAWEDRDTEAQDEVSGTPCARRVAAPAPGFSQLPIGHLWPAPRTPRASANSPEPPPPPPYFPDVHQAAEARPLGPGAPKGTDRKRKCASDLLPGGRRARSRGSGSRAAE